MNVPPDAWSAITALGVAGLGALSAVSIAKLNRNNRSTVALGEQTAAVGEQVGHASAVAEQARDNAAPVANGFAAKVLTLLEGISHDVSDLRAEVKDDRGVLVAHIADHARGAFIPRALDRTPAAEDAAAGHLNLNREAS